MRTAPLLRLLAGAVVVTSATAATPATSATAAIADGDLAVTELGAFTSPTGEAAAEIGAFDPRNDRVWVTNGEDNQIDLVSIADPTSPELVDSIDMSPYGATINSVAVRGYLAAVAVQAHDATDDGAIVLFDLNGNLRQVVPAGALPDMVTISANGRWVVAANEGEPNDDYRVDPDGSITVINVFGTRVLSVRQATFDRFDTAWLRRKGVRIFGPGADAAADLEPEYIAIDRNIAWVTLQENNAIARVDLQNAKITSVQPLGTKDHSLPGNELDASDDDGIDGNLRNWPVEGMYMPDAIASSDGYLFTANEGDARDYDTFEEEARGEDLVLDRTTFPDAAMLQDEANLGRLTVTTVDADPDADGDVDVLRSFGGRSMSVWDPATGALVWDSGALVTELTVAAGTWDDGRADNKGSEPEGIEVGEVDGVTYAFLGLERTSDIVVFDISDPTAPTVAAFVIAPDGAESPEGLEFVSADDAPTGQALLVATYEVTGTTAVFGLG